MISSVIKKKKKKASQEIKVKIRWSGVTGEFYGTFKEKKIIPVIFKFFQNGRQGKLSDFYYTSITLMLKQPRKLQERKLCQYP